MVSWRTKRQAIGFLIVGIIVAVPVFFLARRLLPEPTCFDKKQNQGEFGIDCGGVCVPCELENPRPIDILWTRALPLRKNAYSAAAQIQNPNEVLASQNLSYEFTLFDELGVVARKNGSVFIYPREKLILVETNIKTTRDPTRAEIRILDADWEVFREIPPALVVEKREYRVSEGNSIVEATLLNNSALDFQEAEVRFALFDKAGNVLGVNRIIAENIFSGERKIVKSIWPKKIQGGVATIHVSPRVNLFDPNVILKPQ